MCHIYATGSEKLFCKKPREISAEKTKTQKSLCLKVSEKPLKTAKINKTEGIGDGCFSWESISNGKEKRPLEESNKWEAVLCYVREM